MPSKVAHSAYMRGHPPRQVSIRTRTILGPHGCSRTQTCKLRSAKSSGRSPQSICTLSQPTCTLCKHATQITRSPEPSRRIGGYKHAEEHIEHRKRWSGACVRGPSNMVTTSTVQKGYEANSNTQARRFQLRRRQKHRTRTESCACPLSGCKRIPLALQSVSGRFFAWMGRRKRAAAAAANGVGRVREHTWTQQPQAQ
jgi:hypothetical protein